MGLVKAKIPGRSAVKSFEAPTDLDAPEAASRRLAARRLSAVPGSEDALLARLQVEVDRDVRETLVLSLMALDTEDAVLGLAEHLRGEDTMLRNVVVEALENMPDAIEPHLERMLNDPDPDVRILVCNVLAGLRHERVPAWLREVLERDAHPNVCAAAIDALMEAGTADCVDPLRSAKARFPEEPFLGFAADAAIARIERR